MQVGHTQLQWSDALSVGNETIDRQHRMLIGLLNEANECFRDGGDAVARWRVIADLESYTVYHFDTEEDLMESSGFADQHPTEAKAHVDAHRAFAAEVRQLEATLKQGKPVDYQTLFTFLNNWLVNHVMGTDRQLGAHTG